MPAKMLRLTSKKGIYKCYLKSKELNFVRHRPKALVVERLKKSSKSSNLKQLLRGSSSGNINVREISNSSVLGQLKERDRRGLYKVLIFNTACISPEYDCFTEICFSLLKLQT